MYRFMMERTIFNQLQRHTTSVSKRYYQCSGIGVYGYRPKKVEPFQRKLVAQLKNQTTNSLIDRRFSGVFFLVANSILIKKMEHSLLFRSYTRTQSHQRYWNFFNRIMLISATQRARRMKQSKRFLTLNIAIQMLYDVLSRKYFDTAIKIVKV